MAYALNEFIADCRAILQRDPGPKGREDVRQHLERLLANKDFVAATCGDDVPTGLKLLYEDKDLGFQVLAHVNDKARKSPPHDHGASWAIYGQAAKYTEMIEWERVEQLRKFGGVRIEDNVVARPGAHENLTRRAFAS